MFGKQRQQEYFRRHWAEIWVHFEHFSRKTNAEDLHKVRVGLKKIRALIFLHERVHGKFSKALLKPTDKFFTLSGKVRDAQVAAQLVKKHGGSDPDFFTTQRETVARTAKKLVTEMGVHADELVKSNTSLWKKIRPIRFREAMRVENKLSKKVFLLFYPRLDTGTIHEARKLIKQIVYIHGALPHKLAGRLQVDVQELRSLETLLGEWHDNEFSMELLEEYRPKTTSPIRKLRLKQRVLLGKIRLQFRKSHLRAEGLKKRYAV